MKTLVSVLCILCLATVVMATPTVTFTSAVSGNTGPAGAFNPGDTVTYKIYALVSNNTLPDIAGNPDVAGNIGGVQNVRFNVDSSTAGVINTPVIKTKFPLGTDVTQNGTVTATGGVFDFGTASPATPVTYGQLTDPDNGDAYLAEFIYGGTNGKYLVAQGTFKAAAGGTTTLSLSEVGTNPIVGVNTISGSSTVVDYSSIVSLTGAAKLITVTPEPMTLSLLVLGAIGLIRRKRA